MNMDTGWFYADSQGQQQGPVDGSTLRALLESQRIDPASLVWRDGLREWVPLRQVAHEVGVVMPPSLPGAPPPAPAAAAGARVVAPGRSSSLLVILLVVGLGGVFLLGILAAIAIPAYQDYSRRSRVVLALDEVAQLRVRVAQVWQQEQRCPYNGEDGFGAEADYASPHRDKVVIGTLADDDSTCAIEVTLKPGLGEPAGESARILMYLQADGEWAYESNLPARVLPRALREAGQE